LQLVDEPQRSRHAAPKLHSTLQNAEPVQSTSHVELCQQSTKQSPVSRQSASPQVVPSWQSSLHCEAPLQSSRSQDVPMGQVTSHVPALWQSATSQSAGHSYGPSGMHTVASPPPPPPHAAVTTATARIQVRISRG